MDHFLGLYPRLVWFAPLVLGRGDVGRFVAKGDVSMFVG